MTKAEQIKAHIAKAQYYLQLADKYQQLALGSDRHHESYEFHNELENMADEMDELLMEICIPLEMNTIDIGSGLYDAREGNEDSFSNLDK
jgi:hypothetical protein